MAYDNSGSVFRNTRKREGKKDADFAGSATVAGVEYWVDMWTKPPVGDKKGFFSISFRAKQPRGEQQAQQAQQQRPGRPQPPQRQIPAATPAHRPAAPSREEPYDTTMDPNAKDIPF